MKKIFDNEYILKELLMNDKYYSWENSAFFRNKYLNNDERISLLRKQFLKNKNVTTEDILGWKKISFQSKVEWLVFESMTKKEALLFTFELIKIIMPLRNSGTCKRVIKVGNKFFENNFNHTEFKEELHWVSNETCGAHQCDPVYPWVGYAMDYFIDALESELNGGSKEYSSLGTVYTWDTWRFLKDSISYSFTAIREISLSSDPSMKNKINVEIKKLVMGYV